MTFPSYLVNCQPNTHENCILVMNDVTIEETLLKLHTHDFFATMRLEWIGSLKFVI
jgi:hypothetical protein